MLVWKKKRVSYGVERKGMWETEGQRGGLAFNIARLAV